MSADYWLMLAYAMLFSSVMVCGLLPMVLRLLNARRRFHQSDLERQAMLHSILIDTADIRLGSYLHAATTCATIPYIDDTSID